MKVYRNKDNLTEKELLKAVKASRASDTGKVEEDLESIAHVFHCSINKNNRFNYKKLKKSF